MTSSVQILLSVSFSMLAISSIIEAQINTYGMSLELIKMRLTRQPYYLQEYQLQLDYTHANKVVDYGMVTVNGVQDQADYIFLQAINRNPFGLPRLQPMGDMCFRCLLNTLVILKYEFQVSLLDFLMKFVVKCNFSRFSYIFLFPNFC